MKNNAGRPLIVRGARENNLQNLDVEIPRERLVVVTGVSGSGKSTLAHQIICREGQRRFVESLSPYARQYLGRMDRPQVEKTSYARVIAANATVKALDLGTTDVRDINAIP